MTTPHDRDHSLEQWLSATLPDADAADDGCLDAETAAAWLDGGLDTESRQQAEGHVSSCARCQALVAAVVRLEAADAAAAAPVVSPRRAWLNWMVPLGAVAAAGLALAVWLNAPPRPDPRADDFLQARVEQAPATTPPVQDPERPSAPASVPRGVGDARKAAAPAPPLGVGRTDGGVSTPPEGAGASANIAARAADAAAAAPPPTPPAPAPAASAPASAQSRVAAAEASPPAAATAQQDAAGRQGLAAREASGLDVQPPDGPVRWRLTGRAVLRSADRGATWTTVVADATGRVLAGAAPSATVCWVAGEGGLVLRTADGITFARVSGPTTGDLVSVSATSATAAVVGAADGRRFATRNGGIDWVLVP